MKDLFATIYEGWFSLYDQNYDVLFNELYDGWGLAAMGLAAFIIPTIFWSLFYFGWKHGTARLKHWIICLVVILAISFGIAILMSTQAIYASTNDTLNTFLADPSSGYDLVANKLPYKYGIVNVILTFIFGFVFCLIVKRKSKLNAHLPI